MLAVVSPPAIAPGGGARVDDTTGGAAGPLRRADEALPGAAPAYDSSCDVSRVDGPLVVRLPDPVPECEDEGAGPRASGS